MGADYPYIPYLTMTGALEKDDGISAYEHKLVMQVTLYRRAILAYSEDLPKLLAIIPIVKRNGP
jgi:hypothetical protein